MSKKIIYIGLPVILISGFLAWLFIESTKPLPGEKQPYDCSSYTDFSKLENADTDKCRVHVPIGVEVKYPTSPPTNGPHYDDWVRAGVYSELKDDRNMVHSLEHGYVIISYKCVEEENKEATNAAKIEGSEECSGSKKQLEEIYNKKNQKKIIVVPRPNLDTNFALTAWNYIDKFNDFDISRVEKFIDAHRDNGPERTME